MNRKLFCISITIFLLSRFALPIDSFAVAKENDLVIQDDGTIILEITTTTDVLGATTVPKKPTAISPSPTPSYRIPLVSTPTESIVQIDPPLNDERKMNVTITTTPAATPSKPQQVLKTSSLNSTPTPRENAIKQTNTITKTVDQVIEQDTQGQPILSIKSTQANQVTIQQGRLQVSTPFPVQINPTTHALSIMTLEGPAKISVLPQEAIQGIGKQRLVSNPNDASIMLSQQNGQLRYTIRGEKNGRLLGLIQLETPVEIVMSTETGKVLSVKQSDIFKTFGFLIH